MKIIPCGSDVVIEQANIPGRVTGVTIRFDCVTYEVSYYVDCVQRIVNCTESELMLKSKVRRLVVGYR